MARMGFCDKTLENLTIDCKTLDLVTYCMVDLSGAGCFLDYGRGKETQLTWRSH